MSLRIGGLASGLDTNDLIEKLLAVERQPVTLLQFKQKVATTKADVYKDIGGRLDSLKSLAFDLTLDSAFDLKKASTSNAVVITASAGSNAVAGSYSINVESLAKAHTVASKQYADSSTDLGLTGTFTLNGKAVAVVATDSLAEIRDNINSTADVGAVASIVDNTLRIQRSSSGSTQLAFVDDGGTGVLKSLEILDGADAIKNVLVAASDAVIKIDNQTVTRSTNTITDAITGVTLTLKDDNPVPADPVTLTVSKDVDAIYAKIKGFVDQYNSVQDLIYSKVTEKKVPKPKTESERLQGILQGDPMLSQIRNGLRGDLGNSVSGQPAATSNLSKIGIAGETASGNFTPDAAHGKLKVDDATLKAAIENDLDGVKALFRAGAGGVFNQDTAGIAVRVEHRVAALLGTGKGVTSLEASYRKENDRITKRIEDFDRRIAQKEDMLVRQFSRLESAMSSYQSQSQWLAGQIAQLPKMSG